MSMLGMKYEPYFPHLQLKIRSIVIIISKRCETLLVDLKKVV